MYLASSEKEVCEALKPFVEVRQDGGEVGEEYGEEYGEVGEVIQTATGDIAVVC